MPLLARSALQGRFSVARTLFALTLVLTLGAGCANLPTDYPREESKALEDYQSTTMWQNWAEAEAEHPGESGFAILRYGRNAFNVRVRMIDLAEKTLDLQVYIWEQDDTGWLLAERLIRAADRGVRVRLLIDDLGLGANDSAIASMDAHPNIEMRLFNPFANRDSSMLDFIVNLDRVNHRMHNKSIVMDNSLAVIGGRNIGNHYFGVDPHTNFRDLDIMAVGPIVRDISNVFDYFWRGDWSVPVAALVDRPYTPADLQKGITELRQNIAEGDYPYSLDDEVAGVTAHMDKRTRTMVWAHGRMIWDNPLGIQKDGENATEVIGALRRKFETVQSSLIMESAYFVVGEGGVDRLEGLVDRGIAVRVLTNSLASNDVLAAHAGHANYREELLEGGIALYELRADSGVVRKTWKGESRAGLHTKAIAFDEESLFIGSFNLDPRSANINTEAGLYVESPELTAQLLAYMAEGVLPENSYHVVLDEDGDLLWITEIDGAQVRYSKDPLSSFGQRIMSGFIGVLPVESQL